MYVRHDDGEFLRILSTSGHIYPHARLVREGMLGGSTNGHSPRGSLSATAPATGVEKGGKISLERMRSSASSS